LLYRLLSISLGLVGALWLVSPPCQAQELTFQFSITIDGVSAQDYQFGLHTGALPGIDDDDVPEPPAIPGASFDSFFVLPGGTGIFPNRWHKDFRPEMDPFTNHVELWQLRLQSDGLNHVVTVSIDTVGLVEMPYDLFFFGPGVNFEPIVAPHTFTFTTVGNTLDFFWELRLFDVVQTAPAGWGEVKCGFR